MVGKASGVLENTLHVAGLQLNENSPSPGANSEHM